MPFEFKHEMYYADDRIDDAYFIAKGIVSIVKVFWKRGRS